MEIISQAPRSRPTILWSTDLGGFGSEEGLGCSSDGTTVICSVCAEDFGLISFDFSGNFLWKSDKVNGSDGSCNFVSVALGNGAFARYVFSFCVKIGRDNSNVSFLNKTGSAIWSNPYVAKFQPTISQNGRIVSDSKSIDFKLILLTRYLEANEEGCSHSLLKAME